MQLLLPNFRLRGRILAVLLLPIAGLVLVAGLSGWQAARDLLAAMRVERIAGQIPAIAALVTELQKERGSSLGFIGARGQGLGAEKQAARQAVDRLIPAYRAAVEGAGAAAIDPRLAQQAARVADALGRIAEMRDAVDRLARPAPEVAAFYTAAIEALAEIVETSAHLAENPEAMGAINAISAMMRGKEAAGLERAMGANGFGTDRFPPAFFLRFVELAAQQDAYFDRVRRHGTHEQGAALEAALSSAPAQRVAAMRHAAREAVFADMPIDVTQETWWLGATERLQGLVAAEAQMIEALARIAQRQYGEAGARLAGVGGFALALCIGALVAGLLMVRAIVGPLRGLTGDMAKLAKGDTELALPGGDRRDEIGEMTRAVAVFRDNARERARLEHEKAAADQAEAARQRMMQTLVSAAGEVAAAASHGDFSRRIQQGFADAELRALSEALNELVHTVDAGLNETSVVLDALGQGDLTQRITGHYEGAFATLKDGANGATERLAELIGGIAGAVTGLNGAAQDILAGADDLSQRTTQQAAMVEEAAAALEEFSASVASNASRAARAADVTHLAETRALDGGEVMRSAREAMDRIDGAATKISDVVGLIENIAFQTNLLALNAAVEAARAGETGRGFAVVASEVRRLAQHASEASSEVKALIGESVTEVRAGVGLVQSASGALDAIVGAVKEANTLIGEIAGASREQATAVAEIGTAVRHLDEMTQQNAALVEETNTAIRATEQQVGGLDGMVAAFRLEGTTSARRKAA